MAVLPEQPTKHEQADKAARAAARRKRDKADVDRIMQEKGFDPVSGKRKES